MTSFWAGSYNSLYELFHNNPLYVKNTGPKNLSHRFITEDIPYGIMPINDLARITGVDTPYARALESVACLYLDNDFQKERIRFETKILDELIKGK
jgi:opine dehydrogenase